MYAYELFVDYSCLGLTSAPESIKMQMRTIQGNGGPLSNYKSGTADYKNIDNFLTFDKNGLVK